MPGGKQSATDELHAIVVPREIVNADTVYVVEWTVADGTLVEVGAALCDIDTSKAIVTVEAEYHGYLRHCAQVNDEVEVGGLLGYITARPNTALPSSPAVKEGDLPENTLISAKARKMIEDLGLDASLFAGRGMVREKDVLEAAEKQRCAEGSRDDPRGPFHLEPLSPTQRRVARVMEQSTAAIPAAVLERTIDLAPVGERARALAEESKSVVTEVDLLVAAVARACTELPRFNSFFTTDDQLHLFEEINVGVAVDVEGDLYVVVVRNAAARPAIEIAKELRGLQYLAQRRRLSVEQLSGGTITVTSMIGRGIHRFKPIPYPQQAAIVGIADAEPGSTRASLTLVFDHRIANGTQAAAFLEAVDKALGGEA